MEIGTDPADERWPPKAAIVSMRWGFYFHDVRSHVRKHHAANGPRKDSRKVDNKDAIQRSHFARNHSRRYLVGNLCIFGDIAVPSRQDGMTLVYDFHSHD